MCVSKHKQENDCDGVRSKTKYKAIDKFTELDLVNDFRLLEEATRQVESCRRDKLKRNTRQGTEVMRAPRLPRQLANLQNQARQRGIRLRYLPPHFSRRTSNTSSYDHRTRTISWLVHLVFPHSGKTIVMENVKEKTKLWRLISEFVELKSTNAIEDPFQFYRSVGYGGLQLYLKSEGIPLPGGKARHFYPLDMKRSLKTNLKEKILVEHPIIHIVFESDESAYKDGDELSENEVINDNHPEKEEGVLGAECENSSSVDNLTSHNSDQPEPSVMDTDPGQFVATPEAAMAADPMAYKNYFDFYLKYYTKKLARQTGVSSAPVNVMTFPPGGMHIPPPTVLRPTTVTTVTSPPAGPPLVPNIHCQPPPLPRFTIPPPAPYRPMFSVPPPLSFARPVENDNPPPNSTSCQTRLVKTASVQAQDVTMNENNFVSAKEIKEDIRKSNSLTNLAAYGNSDSDSD